MIKILLLVLTLLLISLSTVANDPKRNQIGSWGGVIFKSDPLLNLHLFLYELARDRDALEEFKSNGAITSSKISIFEKAIKDYRKLGAENNIHIVRSESEIANLTEALMTGKGIDNSEAENTLGHHINEIAPLYNATLWGKHLEKNLEWHQELQFKLKRYGNKISADLERLFAEDLIVNTHTINITYKSGLRQGATTSARSHQTIINSTYPDYSGWLALEMFFHELSHVSSVGRKSTLRRLIDKEFDKFGVADKKGIWHPIQFYTVGETVRRAVSRVEPNYTAYAKANGLYRGHWDYKVLLDKYWMPYLDGLVSMDEAITNIAKALSKEKGKELTKFKMWGNKSAT
ncbi:hypothetical protein ACJJJB_05745 [Microbulbifer sp. ANSA001]|uniref:hypothetical protein n=1 Tax=Microbulbifer sp. ANSA001 TaxID=3243358 RepID=UPI004040EAAE